MPVTLTKSNEEIQQMPLVELAFEILKVKKEPLYFRELMREIQEIRGMSQDEVDDIIARLYTEINIDGRFTCIGQNVWGLNRWYPVDKSSERAVSNKKFVRRTGDAFSDEDEEVFEDEEELAEEDLVEEDPLFVTDDEDLDVEDEEEELIDEDLDDADAEEEFDEPLADEEEDEDEEED